MKRIVSLVVVLVAASGFAATETINGIVWTYLTENGGAVITSAKTSSGADVSGAISIPSTLRGYTVTKVGDSGYGSIFSSCAGISSVVFPNSVTEIGRSMFRCCTGLRTVTFGSGLKAIDNYAFYGCAALREMTLPSGLETIGDEAFSGCALVKTIEIPDSVTSVGSGAFSGCSGATKLKLSSSLAAIKESAFKGCYGIKSVVVPDNVASIGDYAFADCAALATVTIGEGVMSIGSGAFGEYNCGGCTNLQTVFFACYYEPYMGSDVFGYDRYLPANCTAYVSTYSAGGWDATIPGVWNGIQIKWSGSNPIQPDDPDPDDPGSGDPDPDDPPPTGQVLKSLANGRWWSFTADGGVATITGVSQTAGELEIPSFLVCDGVEYIVSGIGAKAFANATDITKVIIPEYIESIAPSAFNGCNRLWTTWFKRLAADDGVGTNTPSGNGSAGATSGPPTTVVTTVVMHVESPYVLSNTPADRAIASITVSEDYALDAFVLQNGMVYDSMLRIVNTANHEVNLTLPSGYVYETFKRVNPLVLPPNSRSILSITRTADKTFLVSREDLETLQ